MSLVTRSFAFTTFSEAFSERVLTMIQERKLVGVFTSSNSYETMGHGIREQ